MNPPGRRLPSRGCQSTRVPRPSQIIDDLHVLYPKQTETDIKYLRNDRTPSTTTTITTSPTHYDEQQPAIMAHVNPLPARRYHLVRIKRAAISCPIIDKLHAHYQKQTEKDIKYPRNTTTTMTTTSPTHYDEARLAKSDDNNETYDATLREYTITMPQFIRDPDDHTSSSTTSTSTSSTRYDVQGIDNRNKQYRESLDIIESHATASKHPIGPLEIAISPYTITTKTQITHSPAFRPTEDMVTLTHAQIKTIYQHLITIHSPTTTTHSPTFEPTEELVPLTHAKTTNTTPTSSNQHATHSNLTNKEKHGNQHSVQHKVPPHRKQ
eukprot:scaffold39446_cov58-Attheya_sp.AAC.2